MRRKDFCTTLLGAGIVALHESAVPAGYKAGPIFWRDLFLAGIKLDSVRWWRHGAHELKNSVVKVSNGWYLCKVCGGYLCSIHRLYKLTLLHA